MAVPQEHAMDNKAAEKVATNFIKRINAKLREAANIADAAHACAKNGNIDRAVKTMMDIESLVHESEQLFKATLLLKRAYRTDL